MGLTLFSFKAAIYRYVCCKTNVFFSGFSNKSLLEKNFRKPISSFLNGFQKRELYINAEGWFQCIRIYASSFDAELLVVQFYSRHDKRFNNHG